MSFLPIEDYQELIEDIVRDGRLYASENHQEILKVSMYRRWTWQSCTELLSNLQRKVSLLCIAIFQTPSLLWAELSFISSLDFIKKNFTRLSVVLSSEVVFFQFGNVWKSSGKLVYHQSRAAANCFHVCSPNSWRSSAPPSFKHEIHQILDVYK